MIIITAIAVLLGCAAAATIVLVRMGIAREESDGSLRGEPRTRTAAVTRRVVGLYTSSQHAADRGHVQVDVDEADNRRPHRDQASVSPR